MRIYTDASTRGNISGLGYIATNNKNIELFKAGIVIDQGDNNTAELLAIIYAIDEVQNLLQKNEKLIILTDSTYAVNAIRDNNYRQKEEAIVKKIQNLLEGNTYSLMWIKGHCQDGTLLSYYNKRADKMSKIVRKQYEKELKKQKNAKLLRHLIKLKQKE